MTRAMNCDVSGGSVLPAEHRKPEGCELFSVCSPDPPHFLPIQCIVTCLAQWALQNKVRTFFSCSYSAYSPVRACKCTHNPSEGPDGVVNTHSALKAKGKGKSELWYILCVHTHTHIPTLHLWCLHGAQNNIWDTTPLQVSRIMWFCFQHQYWFTSHPERSSITSQGHNPPFSLKERPLLTEAWGESISSLSQARVSDQTQTA